MEKVKFIEKNFPALAKYLEKNDFVYWDKKTIHEYWDNAFKESLEYIYAKSKFYKQKYDKANIDISKIKSLEDIKNIPFTEKSEICINPSDLVTVPIDDVSQIHVSTGTTGDDDIFIYYTDNDLKINAFITQIYGKPSDIAFICLPYEMSASGLSFHYSFQHNLKCTVMPCGKGGSYSTPEKTVKLLNDINPTILVTTPTYAAYLYEILQEQKIEIDSKIKTIWLAGEGCSNAFRERLVKDWKCDVIFHYGSLEMGEIGVDCKVKNGYHLTIPNILVEIIDTKTGEPLKEKEVGEIVLTNLLRKGTPLIRYKTNDIGFIENGECACGKKSTKLYLRGRKINQLVIADKNYSPFFIEELLMSFPEVSNWFEFVLTDELDILLIRLELAAGVKEDKSIKEKISAFIKTKSGLSTKIEIVPYKTLQRPKQKLLRVVNERS